MLTSNSGAACLQVYDIVDLFVSAVFTDSANCGFLLFAVISDRESRQGNTMGKKASVPDSTTRALMALASDIADHQALAERIRVQFEALAKTRGVKIPESQFA
jgi:hypothetical protein